MSATLKRQHAVLSVTNAIEEVHTFIDRAIARSAQLIIKTMDAREEIGASGTVAHAALTHMHQGIGVLLAGREHFIANHASLTDLAISLGLPLRADGGFTKPPRAPMVEEQDLASVAA